MYKKIHKRLTLLFTGISGFILAILSLCYLYMSENALKSNHFLAFSTDVSALISNLEQQSMISYEWLLKISANKHYIIALYDKGVPLTYTTNVLSKQEQLLSDEILRQDFLKTLSFQTASEYTSPHIETIYQSSNGIQYYTCTAQLHNKSVRAIIISPMQELNALLWTQRMYLILINLCGILLLLLFSFYYTGKLLSPIHASQQKQNEFISAVSHELRTPLAVILSSISAAKNVSDAERDSFYHTVEKEGQRMSVLVNDMLTLAGADNHTWSFCMESVELDTLLLDTYEAFLPLVKEKKIQLQIILPKSPVPSCLCSAIPHAYANSLKSFSQTPSRTAITADIYN